VARESIGLASAAAGRETVGMRFGLFAAALVSACVLPLPFASAQAPAPWRIGVLLWHRSPNDLQALEGIRNALRRSGRAHELEVVEADSDETRAVELIAQLRARPVALIVAMGTQAALLCKRHVTDLPVVFSAVTNPVESKLVPDWSGSGSNLAGNSNWIEPGTVLDVFRLAVPGLARLGVLRSSSTGVVSAAELASMRALLAGDRAPAVTLHEELADDVDGLDAAVARLAQAKVQAIWIPIDFLVYENIARVAAAARRHGVPLVSSSLRGVSEGAVAGLVVDYETLGERAVLIVLDVLEGRREPGAIQVGRMAGYQVVVNLAAARRAGYEVPLPMLAVADLILDESEARR
jgi:putative ABC transport system substrate-binding protein